MSICFPFTGLQRCSTPRIKVAETIFTTGDILDARHENMIGLIEACHSMVETYSLSHSRTSCRAGVNKDQCDALNLGQLMRQLRRFGLWPGTPSDIASRKNTTNIDTILAQVRSIESYVFPNQSYSPSHQSCSFKSALNESTARRALKAGIVELHKTHLEKQRQKLEPSKMRLTKFQKQNITRTLQ